MKHLKSSSGMSLIGVIMMIAMFAILGTAIMTSVGGVNKSAKKMSNKVTTLSTEITLKTYLTSQNICSSTIEKPLIINSPNINQISIAFNIPALGPFKDQTPNPTLNLFTNKLSVKTLTLAESNSAGEKLYVGSLYASFDLKNGAGVDTSNESLIGPIYLKTNSSGNLIECSMSPMTLIN